MKINVRYLDGEFGKLKQIDVGDWIDLRSRINLHMESFQFELIPLGLAIELPEGYEAIIAPRSSTFKKYGLIQTNGIGIVDNSYCGNNDEWKMPVFAMRDTFIQKGDRIAQFRIIPSMGKITINEVNNLTHKDCGGFGSTGTK